MGRFKVRNGGRVRMEQGEGVVFEWQGKAQGCKGSQWKAMGRGVRGIRSGETEKVLTTAV